MLKRLYEDLKFEMKSRINCNEEERKNHDIKKEVIKSIIDAYNLKEKDKKSALTDDEVNLIIKSKLKQTKDAIGDFEKGNRQDLIDQANLEILTLESYLPKQLSEDEIKKIVLEKVNELSLDINNVGIVMKNVMPAIGSLADGNIVKKIIHEMR